ncbi:hypothetical protein F5Y18DRAFT_435173 [Xylariaceae sp. FL1019]|nr:hypothetical protein F5Y18DRAFT_435173 [Xylariaceae sp. FL1019]
MAPTILEYLTQTNPATVLKSRKGGTPSAKRDYGPDRVQVRNPKVHNASEVTAREAEIFTETSVNNLATLWTKPIVQHALDETHSVLSQTRPDSPLARGSMLLMLNDGPGNIKDDKKNDQRPDWLVYQVGREGGPAWDNDSPSVFNLVPGDSKPSTKWNSEWINHSTRTLKNQADEVLKQVTKYMHLWKTRYSFILSDKELVPVRLSRFTEDPKDRLGSGKNDTQASKIAESNRLLSGSLPITDGNVAEDESAFPLPSEHPDAPFSEISRPTGYVLEWCRVGWDSSGTKNLTVNLVLYWLALLAAYDVSIKEYQTYTPLNQRTRGDSPRPQYHPAEDGSSTTNPRRKSSIRSKRHAQTLDEPESPPKRRKSQRLNELLSLGVSQTNTGTSQGCGPGMERSACDSRVGYENPKRRWRSAVLLGNVEEDESSAQSSDDAELDRPNGSFHKVNL